MPFCFFRISPEKEMSKETIYNFSIYPPPFFLCLSCDNNIKLYWWMRHWNLKVNLFREICLPKVLRNRKVLLETKKRLRHIPATLGKSQQRNVYWILMQYGFSYFAVNAGKSPDRWKSDTRQAKYRSTERY